MWSGDWTNYLRINGKYRIDRSWDDIFFFLGYWGDWVARWKIFQIKRINKLKKVKIEHERKKKVIIFEKLYYF